MQKSGTGVTARRILTIVRWPVGGIRTYLRYVYRKLDPAKYEFTIVAPETAELRVLLEDLGGFNVKYVSTGSALDTRNFLRVVTKTIFRTRFDLIHSHGVTAGLCAVLPSLMRRKPHVMTSHDSLNEGQFKGFRGRIEKLVLSIALPMISVVNSVGEKAQSNLVMHFPRLKKYPNKLALIPNGVEVERFAGDEKRDFRQELGLPQATFLVGFFGRFMSPKGFVYLVDAIDALRRISELPKVPRVLTFGAGGFIREETDYIKRKGLSEYFHFMPFTPNIASSLRGLDVVAMPSVWEASPLLAMETLVAGVPLIGSTCFGLKEVIQGSPATPVPPCNSAKLAEAIMERMKHSRIAEARAYVGEARRRFDVRNAADSLDSLFSGLLQTSRRHTKAQRNA